MFAFALDGAAIPPGAKHPVMNHFPVPTKPNPGPSDYWFPIGWSLFLHDYLNNVPSTGEYYHTTQDGFYWLDYLDKDWKQGTLSKITYSGSNNPWNVVFGIARPTANDINARTVNSTHYKGLAEAAYSAPKKVKVIPKLLERRLQDNDGNKAWCLPAAINWPSGNWFNTSDVYLRTSDNDLGNAIQSIRNSSTGIQQLSGWLLADEPYRGDIARNRLESLSQVSYIKDNPTPNTWYWYNPNDGITYNLVTSGPFYPYPNQNDSLTTIRDDLYFRMKYIISQLTQVWDPNRLVYTVVRWDGNYGSAYPDFRNTSARVCDVLVDDMYWKDKLSTIYWRNMTRDAMNNMLKKDDQTNPPPRPSSYFLFFDGMAWRDWDPAKQEWYRAIADESKLRYSIYTTLVQGARGAAFWFLSCSETSAFDVSEKIARNELSRMAPYLLTPHPTVFNPPNEIYLTTSVGSTTNQDFIIRIHPTDPKKALVIIMNDSPDTINSINIHFPSNWIVSSVAPIEPSYGWSYSLANNTLAIGAGGWWARAFIVTKN